MFLLKVKHPNGWSFTTDYYEYEDEQVMLEAARKTAAKGVDVVVFKPYKKFQKPVPEVVELDV